MILFIHGFASCSTGTKITQLKAHFGDQDVIAPDLSPNPDKALEQLQDLLAQENIDLLIGSSLGGYYADILNRQHHIPSVLINPSTQPFETLARYVGTNKNGCSNVDFQWKASYLSALQSLYSAVPAQHDQYLVLLQTGDEILDYRRAKTRYQHHQVLVEQGGNHRFENISDYLQIISDFRSKHTA